MHTNQTAPEDLFGFTVDLDRGFIVYDCGHIVPISDMWDEDGDWTTDRDEADNIAWLPPGDYPASYKCVLNLSFYFENESIDVEEVRSH